MVNKEQFMNGLVNYVDAEVLPALPTAQKWAVGAIVAIAKSRVDNLMEGLTKNPVVNALGVVSDAGVIDDDAVASALCNSADKYGKLQITIPFSSSTLTFCSQDIQRIHDYVRRG